MAHSGGEHSPGESNPRPFDHGYGVLPTELSRPPHFTPDKPLKSCQGKSQVKSPSLSPLFISHVLRLVCERIAENKVVDAKAGIGKVRVRGSGKHMQSYILTAKVINP